MFKLIKFKIWLLLLTVGLFILYIAASRLESFPKNDILIGVPFLIYVIIDILLVIKLKKIGSANSLLIRQKNGGEMEINGTISKVELKKDQEQTLETMDFELSIFIPKNDKGGEDAPPICINNHKNAGLSAVFDGMGGSGSQTYIIDDRVNLDPKWNGRHSGAFLGARMAREEVMTFFSNFVKYGLLFLPKYDIPILEDEIRNYLENTLRELEKVPDNKPKWKGKHIKSLPTTAAIIYYVYYSDEGIEICIIWSGDSRCYFLDVEFGLQQLSKDDIDGEHDALDSIIKDPTMTNSIDAERVHLNCKVIKKKLPGVLITCSDGAFNYFYTPIHFELEIISCLIEADNPAIWQEKLYKAIDRVKADDVSLSLTALGFSKFEELKQKYLKRHNFLVELLQKQSDIQKRIIELIDDLKGYEKSEQTEDVRSEIVIVNQTIDKLNNDLMTERYSSWNMYKTEFEKYLNQ